MHFILCLSMDLSGDWHMGSSILCPHSVMQELIYWAPPALWNMLSHRLISLTTMFLIVAGGLGFTVWHDVRMNLQDVAGQKRPLKRMFTRLHLQSKIVIVMTVEFDLDQERWDIFCWSITMMRRSEQLGVGEKLLASRISVRDDENSWICYSFSGRTDFGIQAVWMYSDVYRRFSGRNGGRYQDDDNGHLCCSPVLQ